MHDQDRAKETRASGVAGITREPRITCVLGGARPALIAALMLLAAGVAPAQTVIYVDADASGPTHDGTSWCNAYLYLQDALAVAIASDEIRVANGTYTPDAKSCAVDGDCDGPGGGTCPSGVCIWNSPREQTFQLISGVTLEGGYAGCGAPDPDARDITLYDTILSGDLNGDDGPDFANNDDNSYHVVTGSSTDNTAVLDGFTITGGNANGSYPKERGGGMYSQGGTPTVTQCAFIGNTATCCGAGIWGGGGALVITGCTITGNAANDGGGLAECDGPISHCEITDNEAWTHGGGLFACDGTIEHCTVANNRADWGGGLRDCDGPIEYCSITDNQAGGAGGGLHECDGPISNCTISDNYAGGWGGGLGACDGPISHCTISANTAGGNGGGLDACSGTIEGCAITGNVAGNLGGGLNFCHGTINNCLIGGNRANWGGGINECDGEISNCTITENWALSSGGGLSWCNWTISNCIIWGNIKGNPPVPNQLDNCAPPVYSSIQGGGGSLGCIDDDCLFIIPGSWSLIPPYPWDEGDYHLRPGSPCIDAANNILVPLDTLDLDDDGDTSEPTPLDIGGNPRFVDDPATPDTGVADPPDYADVVDMGAHEFQPVILIFVDASATGGDDGTSWADAYRNLQDALADAGALPRDIWVADGTYMPDGGYTPAGEAHVAGTGVRTATFQLLDGVGIYGGFAGGETSLSERNPQANETILSGDLAGDDAPVSCTQDAPDCDSFGGLCVDGSCIISDNNTENSYHVTTGSGADASGVLDGFTITAGNANGAYPENRGGGMYISGGNPTLANCTFSGNSATSIGGGMFNHDSSSPTLTNCTFSGNTAVMGGGMYIGLYSSPTLTNCTFSENTATVWGGGMFNDSRSSPTLTNCTFSGNWADEGGGMNNINSSTATLANCTFSGNWAEFGGGMSNSYSARPTLTNCTFSGNWAANDGGGMFNYDSSSATLTNCTFGGNWAESGGGMYNNYNSYFFFSLTLTNCTFSGNSATYDGGGMCNRDNSSPTLTNSRFGGNSATYNGGGIYNYNNRSPTLTNCILWGNSDSGGTDESAQIHIFSGTPLVNYTLIQGLTGALGGTGNIGDDPLFVDADGADDIMGTEDDDLRLSPGSHAIDAADTTALPNDIADLDNDGDTVERISLDLGGNPRILDDPATIDTGVLGSGVVDMGAFEFLTDCNGNGIPDVCDLDCGTAGEPCDLPGCGLSSDCNNNAILDWCDIDAGTSEDLDTNGVPDECVAWDPGGPDEFWSTAPNWEDNDVPGDEDPADVESVVLEGEGVSIILDINASIDSLVLGEGATLNVTQGDLTIDASNGIRNDGSLLVGAGHAIIAAASMPITGTQSITLTGPTASISSVLAGDTITNATTIAGEGVIDADLINEGLIMANLWASTLDVDGPPKVNNGTFLATNGGRLAVNTNVSGSGLYRAVCWAFMRGGCTPPPPPPTLRVADGVSVTGAALDAVDYGVIEIDGSGAIDVTGAATISSGGIIQGAGSSAGSLSAGSISISGGAYGGGQLFLTNTMQVSVAADLDLTCSLGLRGGCTPPPPPTLSVLDSAQLDIGGALRFSSSTKILVESTMAVTLGGDFDNESMTPASFDWVSGSLVMDGTEQFFEVAGVDCGPTDDGFDNNFAMGRVEVGSGASVTFRDVFANNTCDCQALYVDVLDFQAATAVTLDNCKIYYRTLYAGVTPTLIGCAELQQIPGGAPLVVVAEGPRYLAVTPDSGAGSVALLVSGVCDSAVSCVSLYVQADGTLGASPVFQTPATWETVHVSGDDMLPSTSYIVQADSGTPGAAVLSQSACVTTWAWGNVNNSGGVNLEDIRCVLDGFSGYYQLCTREAVDLMGAGNVCAPDAVIDLADVLAVLDAFSQDPHPCADPCP